MYKCINCVYKGEEIVDERFCPVCGDYVEGKKPVQKVYMPDERIDLDKEEHLAKPKQPEAILELRKNKGIRDKLKEYAEDLMDDGKRNYSNNPKKRSPGRRSGKRK